MDLAAFVRLLTALLMIALPIILGIFLINKFHLYWKLWLIGGAVFIISQIAHIPFNSYILNPLLATIQQTIQGPLGILVVTLFLGLSAGVFEECARYGMFRWWLKDARSWRSAVLAGAGHGGTEAILLGGLVLWTFINLMAIRNANQSSLNLTSEQLKQIQLYWSVPWYTILLPVVERIFTIPIHLMASVLVLQVFTHRPGHQQLWWLGLAILFHTILNGSVVFIASQWGGYAAEAILGGLAVIEIIIIFALRQPEPEHPAPTSMLTIIEPPAITQVEETSENLENTRYQ